MADQTTTITITLEPAIDEELEHRANATGHSKPEVVHDLLLEWLDDIEDIRDATETLRRNEPNSPSSDVRKRLGLER